jgi:undecaprenyl-diphosphatase
VEVGHPKDTEEEATLPVGFDTDDPTGTTLQGIRLHHALIVGLAQVLALFPGVSRSGVTIMAGVFGGLTREAATRFSFLLALPAMLGASALSLPELAAPDAYTRWEIGLGVLAAFLAGYVAIRYLVTSVSTNRLTGFAKYCVVAGVLALAYAVLGPPTNL